MNKWLLLWIASWAAVPLIAASLLSGAADEITPAPTMTPTLPAEPAGGGLVIADRLVVRSGPGVEYRRIGDLPYGAEVYPVGRYIGSLWILIDYNGQDGWISRGWVRWHPDLNTDELPLATLAPAATTELTATPSPTAPSATATQPPVPAATSTVTPPPATEIPDASPLPPSPTPAAAAAPQIEPTVEPAPETATSPDPLPGRVRDGSNWWVAGPIAGALLLATILYTRQMRKARLELRRYADGFPIQFCPACRIGQLYLEENIHRLAGIPVVSRSVRCDHCRSVLRQYAPGHWRVTIDPLANPALSEEYNALLLSDADFHGFVERARAFEPSARPEPPGDISPAFQSVVEHLEELEAEIIALQEQEARADQDESPVIAETDGGSDALHEASPEPSQEDTGDAEKPGEAEA
jgi:hypothetical protein